MTVSFLKKTGILLRIGASNMNKKKLIEHLICIIFMFSFTERKNMFLLSSDSLFIERLESESWWSINDRLYFFMSGSGKEQ